MNVIYKALGTVLSFFDSILGSYLLAVMLFALIVKILLFPLGIKQQKNQQKQAALRPKEMAIRKKYKGMANTQEVNMRMNNEIQEMYRENNYSMFGGCLPLLVQLPFIFIIYRVITSPLQYISKFSTTMIGEIEKIVVSLQDSLNGLSSKLIVDGVFKGDEFRLASILGDKANFELIEAELAEVGEYSMVGSTIPDFSLFGVNLGEVPSFTSWLILIPIISFLAQFFSMKLNRKMSYQPAQTADQGCSNNVMDITMPLMTTVMTFMFPALLGVYWIFQTVLGVLQQFILKLIWPLPVLTEEDYKNAERALKGKPAKGGATVERGFDTNKKYRSLHTIDDDEDDIPVKEDDSKKNEENEESETTEAQKRKEAGAPELKEDNPERNKKK